MGNYIEHIVFEINDTIEKAQRKGIKIVTIFLNSSKFSNNVHNKKALEEAFCEYCLEWEKPLNDFENTREIRLKIKL